MKRFKVVAYVCAVTVGVCVMAGITMAAEKDDAWAGIEGSNKVLMQAFGRQDAAGVANCYTADAQLLPPGAAIVEGLAAIQQFWQAGIDSGATGLVLTTTEVRSWDDEAHEIGTYTMSGDGGQTLDAGKYIVIWKRVEDQWKLHRDIWNSNAP